MELQLIFIVLFGMIMFAVIISLSIILLWMLRHIRKIKKSIPQKLKGGNLNNGYEEIKEEIERTNRGRGDNRRGYGRRYGGYRREEKTYSRGERETDRSYEDDYYPKRSRRVQVLPSEQPSEHKRNSKKDWENFD